MITIRTYNYETKSFEEITGELTATAEMELHRERMLLCYASLSADANCVFEFKFKDEHVDTNFYTQSAVDSTGIITPDIYTINTAGNYRFPIPVSGIEDAVQLTVSCSADVVVTLKPISFD